MMYYLNIWKEKLKLSSLFLGNLFLKEVVWICDISQILVWLLSKIYTKIVPIANANTYILVLPKSALLSIRLSLIFVTLKLALAFFNVANK